MALTEPDISRLFKIVYQTIEAEDERLARAMHQKAAHDPHRCYAGHYPQGLSPCFDERAITFLIFRAFLEEQNFPFEFICEHGYPNGKGSPSEANKMDFAIFERSQAGDLNLVGAVELKWWRKDDGVHEDIRRLGRLPNHIRKLLLLLGTWDNATFALVAEEVKRKFKVDLRPEGCNLFPIHGTRVPKKFWSHFYVLLLEL